MAIDTKFKYSDFFLTLKGTDIPAYVVYTDGQLTPRIAGETYTMPECIEVGDFNNDHLDDLVVTYGDTYARPLFYISQGDGTFALQDLAPEGSERRHIRNSTVVDLNQDGYLDYVGFCAPHGFYEGVLGPKWDYTEPDLILINQQGKGFLMVNGLAEGSHHGGAVGDVDQDGLIDVMGVAEFSSRAANGDPRIVLLQKPDGSFQRSTDALTGIFSELQISDLRMNDLNGDGITDYVFMISPNEHKINNSPLGTPMASSALGTLAWAYGKVGATLNDLDWKITGTHWMDSATWQTYLKFNDQNTGQVPSYSCGPSNVELLDVNADGRLDILQGFYVSAPFSWQTSGFKYFENTGNGFVDLTDQVFPDQVTNRSVQSPTGFILGFNLVDLDGDGYKDLVITSKQNERPSSSATGSASFFMNHNGVFKPANLENLDFSLNGWAGLGMVSTGDFNGDGAPDLVSIQNAPEGLRVATSLNKTPGASQGITTLRGTSSDDVLTRADAKVLRGLAGNDQLVAGAGMQSAEYYGPLSNFLITRTGSNEWMVKDLQGNEGTDQLKGIERIVFADAGLAIDLDASAGLVAKTLGAVFGPTAVANQQYAGIGLHFVDVLHYSYADLIQLAMDARLGANASHAQVVDLLYTNVVGTAPDAATRKVFTDLLDSGAYSVAGLGVMAADTPLNQANIHLVGLAQTGLVYLPVTA